MGIIEKAAKRLEELKRAGVDIGGKGAEAAVEPGATETGPEIGPTPLRAVRAAEAASLRTSGQQDARQLETDLKANGSTPGGPETVVVRDGLNLSATQTPVSARKSREVQIDLDRLAANGFISAQATRSSLADEFRVIKRPLLDNVHGRSAAPVARANLIMITSSIPGEGKTFTAINLALSIAMELDNTVLLVDADVARPAILSRFGLADSPGLLDLLVKKDLDVADVLLKTNVEKLTLLPAGKPQSRATELLASESMNRLVDELATRYPDRILIFDAPPLLPSTESRVLATHMGQVVVVVEADRTLQSSLSQALATVESCPVVMTLLNKIQRSEVGSYYGYYGYGYS